MRMIYCPLIYHETLCTRWIVPAMPRIQLKISTVVWKLQWSNLGATHSDLEKKNANTTTSH